MFDIPILFIIFNREDITKVAFEKLDITLDRFDIKNNIVREIKRIIRQIKNLFRGFSK